MIEGWKRNGRINPDQVEEKGGGEEDIDELVRPSAGQQQDEQGKGWEKVAFVGFGGEHIEADYHGGCGPEESGGERVVESKQ